MEKMKYPCEWRGEKGMEITHRVVDYIQKHHLSAEEIAGKTGRCRRDSFRKGAKRTECVGVFGDLQLPEGGSV